MTEASPSPIVRTLSPTDVPPAGTHVTIEADATARAALAALAEVVSVEAMRAEFQVKPWGRDGFLVEGRVTAALTQACVVTLEPLARTVDEPVSLKLAPPETLARWLEKQDEEGAIDLDLTADVPEPLEGGAIDLGTIAVEHFLVGIDPYPRKEGAVFDAEALGIGGAAAELSPFAALARLEKE